MSADAYRVDRELLQRITKALAWARTAHMPLASARLHVGDEVRAAILRNVTQHDGFGQINAYGGIPVVVEEDEDPTYIELRWSVRG